jgi:type II secretory pathway component PulF
MKFAYEGYDAKGAPASGSIEAPDEADAISKLKKRGVFVTEIRESQGKDAPAKAPGVKRGKSAGPKHVAMMARELSVLVSTGTTVVDALAAVERQASDEHWRGVVRDVRSRVEEGNTLHEALGAHSATFDAVFRSLVAAGESSGNLDDMLARLATLTRRQMAARASVMGAMIYPVLLISVASIVLTLMMIFVLPRFEGLFETLGAELPSTTKLLMSVSELLRGYWWGLAPLVAIGVIGGVFYTRTPAGQRALDTLAVRAPQFGVIVRSLATARLTRLLGMLLESKVPMMDALSLTKQSMSNSHYVELLESAEEAVTRGESISDAFNRSDLVTPATCEAIRNGEQSGSLAAVLVSVAEYLDEENDTTLRSIGSVIEPLIMIVLGVIVGFVAVSMFLPLFDLTASAGGGGAG